LISETLYFKYHYGLYLTIDKTIAFDIPEKLKTEKNRMQTVSLLHQKHPVVYLNPADTL